MLLEITSLVRVATMTEKLWVAWSSWHCMYIHVARVHYIHVISYYILFNRHTGILLQVTWKNGFQIFSIWLCVLLVQFRSIAWWNTSCLCMYKTSKSQLWHAHLTSQYHSILLSRAKAARKWTSDLSWGMGGMLKWCWLCQNTGLTITRTRPCSGQTSSH